MIFSSFNFYPQQTQTPPVASFCRLEPARNHTPAHVTYWTLEVWLLTGFNILNRRPHTKSIAGTYALLQFQCLSPTDPNSSSCVILSVRTCTAPRTRTCNLLDSGGLVAHGFQLFERETPHPIDGRYLCPSPVLILNLNVPKLHLLRHFFG